MATDIYIGFMDEEVASLLKYALATKRAKKIEVYERGLIKASDTHFLERPWASYSNRYNKTFDYYSFRELFSSKTGKDSDQAYLDYMRNRVDKRIDDNATPKTTTTIMSKISFEVIDYRDADKDALDKNIIFIRSGEMGKQPGVTRLYLRLLLRHLKNKNDLNNANIFCYAAGGGIIAGGLPGTLRDIKGSVFAGPDVDSRGTRYPNVEFAYQKSADGQPLKFGRTGSHTTDSFDAIMLMAERLLFNTNEVSEIRNILSTNTVNFVDSVSMSFSYFDGTDTKIKVDEIYNTGYGNDHDARRDYIVNSNMEDYHLFRILNSMTKPGGQEKNYPALDSYKVIRVDTNIRASNGLKVKVEAYIDDKMMGQDKLNGNNYVALHTWGQSGCQVTPGAIADLPDIAKYWHKQDALNAQGFSIELLTFKFDDNGNAEIITEIAQIYNAQTNQYLANVYCLNPFCVEIATDYDGANNLAADTEYGFWLRGGNKWPGLKNGGFTNELPDPDNPSDAALKEIMKREKNIDRMLYKSSGAAALQSCVKKAWRAFQGLDVTVTVVTIVNAEEQPIVNASITCEGAEARTTTNNEGIAILTGYPTKAPFPAITVTAAGFVNGTHNAQVQEDNPNVTITLNAEEQ